MSSWHVGLLVAWVLSKPKLTGGWDLRLISTVLGLDLTHPDFNGRVTEGDNGRSFITGEGVQDGHGHGTHCAGSWPDRGSRRGVDALAWHPMRI